MYAPYFTSNPEESYAVLGPKDGQGYDGDILNLREKKGYWNGDQNDEIEFLQKEMANHECVLLFTNGHREFYAIRCGQWSEYDQKYLFTKCRFREDQTGFDLGEWGCIAHVLMKEMDTLIKYTNTDEVYLGCFK